MDRRRFLGWMAGAAAGCATSGPVLGPGAGAPWGEAPAGVASSMLPASRVPEGMLEVFLLGGMSPWESFYCIPELTPESGRSQYAGQQWWTFQNEGPVTLPQWWDACGAGSSMVLPWREETRGHVVNIGPFAHPLWDRPDLLARMRVWVMRHDFEPHEAGTPLAMTGHGRGNPRGASLGTHVQRWAQGRGPISRTSPYAYTVYMSSFDPDAGNNGDTASAVGLHPGWARPMAIRLGPGASGVERQLRREALGGRAAAHDALVDWYAGRRSARLAGIRSAGHDGWQVSRGRLGAADGLAALLGGGRLERGQTTACHTSRAEPRLRGDLWDETTTGMALARHLLTTDVDRARYVQVVDSGLYLDPEGMGFDSHTRHVEQQGTNIGHSLRALAATINRPGENDPQKLDLDRHFVLLNCEFGRAPYPERTYLNPEGSGTNHWPFGYVVVGFGGFVEPEHSGIVGAIGANGMAMDDAWITPTEHRAAMLLAMGIWPFSPEGFAVGDVRAGSDEAGAARWLLERVLGA